MLDPISSMINSAPASRLFGLGGASDASDAGDDQEGGTGLDLGLDDLAASLSGSGQASGLSLDQLPGLDGTQFAAGRSGGGSRGG